MTRTSAKYFLILSICFSVFLQADPPYPRVRYIIMPIPGTVEFEELPAWATGSALEEFKEMFNNDSVSLWVEVDYGPHKPPQRIHLMNNTYESHMEFLKNAPPAFEHPELEKLKDDIEYLRHVPEEGSTEVMDHVLKLKNMIGPIRTQYLLHGIKFYPPEVLHAIAGIKSAEAEYPFLSLRRFGVLRRRSMHVMDSDPDDIHNFLRRNRAGPDDILNLDFVTHMVVGEVKTPYIPGFLPPHVQSFTEATSYDGYTENHPSLLVAWAQGSEEVHDLSYRAYKAQIARGHRPSINDQLLSSLKAAANALDLSRIYFVVIEDYVREKALEVMAFIDGGLRVVDYYKLPIENRFPGIDFREMFPDELIEVHGLAVDPDASDMKGVLNADAMALQLLEFIEGSGHEKTTFVLQADALPARLYKSFGFNEIEGSSKMLAEPLIAMFATGEVLKTRIRDLFPHVRRINTPELPNKVNRRIPGPEMDTCLTKLRNFGYL